MAVDNSRWGAERIRGELLKLGIRVSPTDVKSQVLALLLSLAREPEPRRLYASARTYSNSSGLLLIPRGGAATQFAIFPGS